MPFEAGIAEPTDQAGSAARHSLQRGQAASAPVPSVAPVQQFALRAISSVDWPPHDDRQSQSLATDATLRQSSQSGPSELSSSSTQQSAESWPLQQQPPAAGTAQGSDSSSTSVQPNQQQPAAPMNLFTAAAAAAAAHAGPSPFAEAAGAAAVPPQLQPLHAFAEAEAAAAAAAAVQPAAATQEPAGELEAAFNAFDPFGGAAAAAADAEEASQAPLEQVTAAHTAYNSASVQAAGPAAQAAWLWSSMAPPSMPPVIGEAGFSGAEEVYEFAAYMPPPTDAGPAAAAELYVDDMQVLELDYRVFSFDPSSPLSTEGSFGDVYLGTRGNDRVAVKVLRAELGEDLESLQARLRQEYKAQRAVQHEGVLKVLAVCLRPPAIVTELCQCSLSDRIRNEWAQQQQQQQDDMSWALVVNLLGQAADALAHIHAPNPTIIHNDLRAANILLAAAPQGNPAAWQAKICDFGLAVQVPAGAAEAEARIPMVTDHPHGRWVAPEVKAGWVEGQGYPVTPAADVYALGCVLYEMMVPNPPARTFPTAQQRLPGLMGSPPAGLQQLFEQCLRERPHRPSAAGVWELASQIMV